MKISNEEITVAVIRKETLSWRDLLFALEMPDAAQWDELNQITVVAVKSIATSDVVDGGVE